MVVAANFNDDLVFILAHKIEISVVWVCEPHRVVVRSSTSVDMLDDHEFAIRLSSFKLILKPIHLLDARPRTVAHVAITIVIERIDGQDRDSVAQVHSIVATVLKSLLYLSDLLFFELRVVSGKQLEPKVEDVAVKVRGVFVRDRVVMVLRIVVAKGGQDECVGEHRCD